MDYIYPPPTYKLNPKDPLEVDSVPPGRLIAEFPRMMSGLMRNMKRKLMVGVAFVLFVPNATSHNGGSYTIYVLREIHAEIILIFIGV